MHLVLPWLTLLVGLLVAIASFSYGHGSIQDPGPGFFPLIVGTLMIVFGILEFVSTSQQVFPTNLAKGLIQVAVNICVFAAVYYFFGVMPAAIAVCAINTDYSTRPAFLKDLQVWALLLLTIYLTFFVLFGM